MCREAGLRLPARGMVAATERRSVHERQKSVASDARTGTAGAFAGVASAAAKRLGPCGSRTAESDLAVGHDQNLGGSDGGLGLSCECDRLLHAGDRGLESVPP